MKEMIPKGINPKIVTVAFIIKYIRTVEDDH